MFAVLPASAAPAGFKPQWLTTSAVLHALVIALAVVTTKAALHSPRLLPPEDMMLVFVPKAPEPPPPPAVKPENPAVVSLTEPPPQGFQTLAAPSDIPNVIPPVDLSQRPLDPRDFTGRGVEGGVGNGVVGGTGPIGLEAIYQASTDLPGFEPAVVLSQPMPKYPTTLESVGIEGRVVVEFVIDTAGKVEPSSIRTIESTYQAFESAAHRSIAGSMFRPAHLQSVPVRQLTHQSVRFVAAH